LLPARPEFVRAVFDISLHHPVLMPNPATNSGIRDNHRRGVVADFLKAKIHSGSRLSVVSAYFTIYAYDALPEHLNQIDHLDSLFGEPRFIASLDPDKAEKKAFILDGHGLQLANRLEQKRVARDCAEWMRNKVDIRSIRHTQLLHGKMYHIANAGVEEAILGSSNFTVRGLGLGAGNNNIELNLEVDSNRDRRDLKVWFDELWNDPALVEDVKADVLQYLDQLYQNHAPEFIYFKTLFHVFENFLADQEKGGLLDKNIKIVDTEIWKACFELQRDGVKGAINKILKHNGCILADSVGLGKTFEALAVIKYFGLKNERVLVLCPKKLRENWTVYQAQNNSLLNPFINDRFAYTVLSHTDLSREDGFSGDINLQSLNWGNFDLVVIDESHNFRNNTPGKRDEDGNLIRKSRYQRLLDDIIKSGVKTKVLLLSATPVNNDLRDLRKPYIEAKDIARWTYQQYRWLEWGTDRSPDLLTRPTFVQLYEVAEKIVAADVSGAENRAAYDTAQVFHSHTLISFVPWQSLHGVRNNSLKKSARYRGEKPRHDLPKREELEAASRRFAVKYLLGVMNSSAARDFLRANRRSNTDLYPDDWKKLPIPDVPTSQQHPIVALVDQILTAKRANTNGDISTLEQKLDEAISCLYGLPSEEITIVEEAAK